MIIDEVQLDRPELTFTGADPANPLEFDLTHNYNITLFVTASARSIFLSNCTVDSLSMIPDLLA
jgi:hypothetical protein